MPFGALSEISLARQKQLDSFVTNLPREVVRDLDSAHLYMDQFASSEEERVFSFYGFLSIHFKYDTKRAGGGKVKEYTPYYTCRKRSGVCRDFSYLFKELCDRSGIPCVYANGRAKGPFHFKTWIKEVVLLHPKVANHAWNIVKFNGSWHLMDPTWTEIASVDKYYTYDEKGRKKYVTKAKRPSREYYDSDPAHFYEKRSAMHPAYYTSTEVPTFKTARRKIFKKKHFSEDYDYVTVLDSLGANPYYRFTPDFVDVQDTYAQRYSNNGYEWYYMLSFLELKRTEKNALTIQSCKDYIQELDGIKRYLESKGAEGAEYINTYKILVLSYILVLQKKEERLNAKAGK